MALKLQRTNALKQCSSNLIGPCRSLFVHGDLQNRSCPPQISFTSKIVTMAAITRITFVSLVVATLNLLFTAKHSVAQLVSTGQTVLLDGLPYYVPATALTTVKIRRLGSLPSAGGLVPVTVVDSLVNLHATVQAYEKVDDVWTTGFLGGNA